MGKKRSPKGPKNNNKHNENEVIKPEFGYEGFDPFTPYEEIVQEPFKPMKNRLFDQNYKPVISENKYYKVYDLVAPEESEYILMQTMIEASALEYDKEFITLITDTHIVSCKMEDRIEKDLRSFSRRCRDVLFTVNSFGEDFEQIKVHFAINGKYYTGNGQINYEGFNYGLLK